jgi:hypothetical protein
MSRQLLNLFSPMIIEWDIKLSLYQSLVIAIISLVCKSSRRWVTNQYDRVLVGKVACLVFVSRSEEIVRERL